MAAMGSHLTNKYAEGYPDKRYYGGCEYVDVVENIARDRACQLFGAEHANVQPNGGSSANFAVYFALLQPGDKVLGMDLSHGGHLTHGSPVNMSGQYYTFYSYGLDPETECIDYDEVRKKALEKVGADRVVIPERETGIKLAQAITSSSILDFIELSKDCGIAEIHTPESWFGKTLRELNIRAKLGVNIIAIRHDGKIEVAPGADFALKENTVLVVLGTNDKLAKLKP